MIQNTFYVVRHGESENNILEIDVSGIENKHLYGLTEKGERSIQNHANRYNDFNFIYTSPLRRALESANIFAATSQCSVHADDRLIELQFGDFDMSPYGSSGITEKAMRLDKSLSQPNGENWQQLESRVISCFEDINNKHSGESILLVTHGVCVEILIENFSKNFDWDAYWKDDDSTRQVFKL